jgi:hypothetical protein
LVGPKDLLAAIVQSPKSEIQARGGVSLLTRMLAYESELIEFTLIVALKEEVNREINSPLLDLRE